MNQFSLFFVLQLLPILVLLGCSDAPAESGNGPDKYGFEFEHYYADAIGKNGDELASALNLIIRDHTRLSYAQVWDALMVTDEDPANSANVILFYSGRSIDKGFRDGQVQSTDSWNREHIWPKSHGFPAQSQHAYTDLHHLRPVDSSINSTRSNKDYDEGGTPITEAPQNKRDRDSFEPGDAVKGDAARMIFYMAVRYQGDDDSNTPDLFLVDYTDTESGQPVIGKLCTLLKWHNQDPVSSREKYRNQMVFERQHNRNPFIDNPDWANTLYGRRCG